MSVAAIVLAAGRSTRMGGANKLIETLEGKALVRWAVEAACNAHLAPVIVVTGHQGEAVARALEGLDVCIVANPAYAQGLSTSLKAGVAALGVEENAAVVVLLADMPLVDAPLIRRMVAAFEAAQGAVAAVPVHCGEWGNPVVIARALFPEIAGLGGDAGARKLLVGRAAEVVEVPVGEDSVRLDVDTPETLRALRERPRPG